jgi:hypothetical protein
VRLLRLAAIAFETRHVRGTNYDRAHHEPDWQTFSVSSNLKLTHLQSGSDATMGYDTGYYTYDIKPIANLPKGGVGHGSYMTLTRKEGATWQITYTHIAADPVKANK